MIISPLQQAYLFLGALLIGFVLGFTYDLLRVFRKIVPHPKFVVHIEDLLFWITVTIAMFYFMLSKNYGEVRGFSIIAALIGMLVYFLTVSKLFMKVSMAIYEFIKKTLIKIFYIILIPLKFIITILSKPLLFLEKKFLKILRKQKKNYNTVRRKGKIKKKKFLKDFKIIFKKK